MGGARRYPYPKWVWSPAGGWWNTDPVGGKRNALIYVACCMGISYIVYNFGEANTVSIIII